jgi:hypothetical protein
MRIRAKAERPGLKSLRAFLSGYAEALPPLPNRIVESLQALSCKYSRIQTACERIAQYVNIDWQQNFSAAGLRIYQSARKLI